MPVERCSTSIVVDVPASNNVNAFISAAFVRPVSYGFSWPIFSGAFNYVDEVVNRAAIRLIMSTRLLIGLLLIILAHYFGGHCLCLHTTSYMVPTSARWRQPQQDGANQPIWRWL